MENANPLWIAWDAWRAERGGMGAVMARQHARLADLVRFARTHSRFYAELYRDLPESIIDVMQLPHVTKPQLMARFDDWVTDPEVTQARVEAFVADPSLIGQDFLGRYVIWTTSGSTGAPANLVQDRRALAVYTSVAVVRGYLSGVSLPDAMRDLWRIVWRGVRVATLIATGGHFGGVVMAERGRRRNPRRANRVKVFSVLSPLPELVAGLNAYQPTIINGYASAIALLAHEQAAGRLRIHPVLIGTTAERLEPTARAHIEKTFGCQVRDSYGASDAGGIAFDCGRGWKHVAADWVTLEPVDEKFQPVPPGQPSYTVLVTNLANRVQPIIRYDLGDSVTVKPEPCTCGSPLPAIRVEGRTDEVLAFPAKSGRLIRLLPMSLATVVEETPGVQRFQLIQTAPSRLEVRLETKVPEEDAVVWEAVMQRLHTHLTTQGVAMVGVERAAQPPRPDPGSGKFCHVWADKRSRTDIISTSRPTGSYGLNIVHEQNHR